ncbi:MAG TPA: chromosomal replication initiator protein DnaA [Blastocatellia bacterium]|nr:chromosomal replication initiator protein DnaA [Blastocatellia bacterium]
MFANVWESVASSVETKINQQSFSTWFRPITYSHSTESSIFVKVPNQLFVDWICSNFSEVLQESLIEQGLRDQKLQFLIDESVAAHAAAAAASVGGRLESRLNDDELRFSDSLSSTRLVDLEPLELPLNQKYTFESFVVGSCNQFAHAAALAVAESPSKAYNPLFIYGGVGLGKTHLMHAVGHTIRSRNRHFRLMYISSEKFMNEMINSIRYDKTATFREKYRNIDVLLMDDIQFLAGKERTQEEFFHTFNALYDAQKQIIISSDCPPREIPTLEERLHSRFEWGLIADIQPPDLETKVAILRRKAELEKIDIPDNVALFIASKIKSNIRELEGSLVRLTAYASLTGSEINLKLAQEVLKSIIEEDDRNVSIDSIQKVVADHYGLKVSDLKSKNNSRSIAVPRQVAMYLCKQLTKASLPEIGKEFGGKHHTTAIHSINKIAALYETDGNFHRLINNLIATIK